MWTGHVEDQVAQIIAHPHDRVHGCEFGQETNRRYPFTYSLPSVHGLQAAYGLTAIPVFATHLPISCSWILAARLFTSLWLVQMCRHGAQTSSVDAPLLFDSVTFVRSLRKALRKLLISDRTESFVADGSQCFNSPVTGHMLFPLTSLFEYNL